MRANIFLEERYMFDSTRECVAAVFWGVLYGDEILGP